MSPRSVTYRRRKGVYLLTAVAAAVTNFNNNQNFFFHFHSATCSSRVGYHAAVSTKPTKILSSRSCFYQVRSNQCSLGQKAGDAGVATTWSRFGTDASGPFSPSEHFLIVSARSLTHRQGDYHFYRFTSRGFFSALCHVILVFVSNLVLFAAPSDVWPLRCVAAPQRRLAAALWCFCLFFLPFSLALGLLSTCGT